MVYESACGSHARTKALPVLCKLPVTRQMTGSLINFANRFIGSRITPQSAESLLSHSEGYWVGGPKGATSATMKLYMCACRVRIFHKRTAYERGAAMSSRCGTCWPGRRHAQWRRRSSTPSTLSKPGCRCDPIFPPPRGCVANMPAPQPSSRERPQRPHDDAPETPVSALLSNRSAVQLVGFVTYTNICNSTVSVNEIKESLCLKNKCSPQRNRYSP